MSRPEPVRVVILGGGFAGLNAATALERALPGDSGVEITIVNRDNFLLFTPMLHEVAASDLDLTHIVTPIRRMVRRAVLFVGTVEAIDLPGRRVLVRHTGGGHAHSLPYDHLVLALGSVTNFFGLPGLEERALTMKSLADAIALRNRLIEVLEEADFECAAPDRHQLLTVLVAGGGFAGVETVAAVNDFLREAIAAYPRLTPDMLRLVLVHSGQAILPELAPTLGGYAARALGRRGVDIRLGTRVTGVSEDGVCLSDGSVLPAQTIVWTAGTAPNPLLAALPCRQARGRVVVDDCLRVADWPNVWALGDCAQVPDGAGGFHPPTAQHALRQGRTVGRNIAASLLGRPARPFVFSTLGQLAAIGRRTGVANILGVNFSGFLAWWLWRSIYLSKLPGIDRKVRVALDWTLDLLFEKDLVQFRTDRVREVEPVGVP
jgi:NADH dehydrogenase